MEEEARLPLWESLVVFQDHTSDGRLTLSVWRDDEPETMMTKEFGCMGTMRVYDSYSGEIYHEERIALSIDTLYGPGPSNDDVQKWLNILSLF